MRKDLIDAAWTGRAPCMNCGIRDLVLFADLAEADFNLIHLPIDEVEVGHGNVLYSPGDEGVALYTIRSGLVKLVQYLPDGSQRIVRLLRPGATAGLEVVIGHLYEHAAIALQPVRTCRIPREVVDRLNRETPRLHAQLMKRWHNALKQADDWLTELSTGKAPQRLARLLLQIAEPDGMVMLFAREDLGSMLGITTEHASRTVAEFKRNGAILDKRGSHYRGDIALLERIASSEG